MIALTGSISYVLTAILTFGVEHICFPLIRGFYRGFFAYERVSQSLKKAWLPTSEPLWRHLDSIGGPSPLPRLQDRGRPKRQLGSDVDTCRPHQLEPLTKKKGKYYEIYGHCNVLISQLETKNSGQERLFAIEIVMLFVGKCAHSIWFAAYYVILVSLFFFLNLMF